MIEIFTFPFMQRAFVAGGVLSILLSWLGVYVITRGMSFIGDGIAHASLAAIAFAFLVGWSPLPVAVVFSILLAVLIYLLTTYTTLPRDSVINILLTTGMALGIVLLQYYPGFAPELMSVLFGNILGVQRADVVLIVILGLVMLLLLFRFHRSFTFLAIDPEGATLAGVHRGRVDLLLTIMISLTVVLSVKLIGIILVSALLVTPSAIAKVLARSFFGFQVLSVGIGFAIITVGLILSFYLDLPSGSVIVLLGTVTLLLTRIGLALRR